MVDVGFYLFIFFFFPESSQGIEIWRSTNCKALI